MSIGNTMRAAARCVRAVATDERAFLDADQLEAYAERADALPPCDTCDHGSCSDIRAAHDAAKMALLVLEGVDVAQLTNAREALHAVERRWPSTTPGDYPIAAVRHAYIAGYTDGAVAQRAKDPVAEAAAPTPLSVARAVALALTEVTGLRLDATTIRQIAHRATGTLLELPQEPGSPGDRSAEDDASDGMVA
ncbi:hypothetical protein ATL41_1541 [Flavimobilis soli]|jgi:hypothetical protein|uniref:Uncharacterized protein n=1 Tax=Flavimobilis soli TaxID=442709 RepID=A0A2A9EEV7_9MICO|nr:hypothetical protein [Flavimobilis soli]PFG36802.1 hypothetical protein ATL41_1541 [Flavimobilis soli]